jgi:hypothetical protein
MKSNTPIPKICIYLKPSIETILSFKVENIQPISKTLGFHTTIHNIDYVCHLEIGSTEEEFDSVLRMVNNKSLDTTINTQELENWNHPTLTFEKNNQLKKLHLSLAVRFNMNGILINNTYANVNPTLFREEHGFNPNGYNPHMSLSKKPESILKEIEFQPYLFSRVKTVEGIWEEEKSFKFLKKQDLII